MEINFNKIFITAEIGLNHNNNFIETKKLIHHAIDAGADAVKFQLFKSSSLYKTNSKEYKFLKKYETKFNFYKKIETYCKKKNIICYASPFDKQSINFLIKSNTPIYKWASSEIGKLDNLKKISSKKKLIIISTGMANKEDIKDALKVIKKTGNNHVVLMHCVSEYPQKIENANINKLDQLRKFGFKLGFSDHSNSSTSAILAIAKGVRFLEKHITLDKEAKGPDHFYATDIKQFKKYVKDIRDAEQALGSQKLEYDTHVIFNTRRESYYAKKFIKKGTKLKYNHMYLKRSLEGLNINSVKKFLNKKTKININKHLAIKKDYFK